MEPTKNSKELHFQDAAYIHALKSGCSELCRRFFYKEISGILHKIRIDVFHGKVGFDELVSELYLYLSKDDWSKFDSFDGRNDCRLRTWMIPVAWRYFVNIRDRLLYPCNECEAETEGDSVSDDLRIQIAIDVNGVLARMPNRRYAEIIRLLIVEGYAAQDVAEMLDVKVANVYNMKHRAVVQFIELYGRR